MLFDGQINLTHLLMSLVWPTINYFTTRKYNLTLKKIINKINFVNEFYSYILNF